MPEQRSQKNQFQLNKGLNTESNEIGFPDGYTTDEANFELFVDGSRRRRKGLQEESGGSNKAVGITISATQVQHSYKWRGAGGDPANNFIVHQIGQLLFFTSDQETISTSFHSTGAIELDTFQSSASVTAAQLRDNAVEFSHGRGHLFVTGKYIKPFYVDYDATGDTFTSSLINLLIRDFDGIEDGVGIATEPTGAIDADHRYNLRNRGHKQDDMDTFFSDKSKHPSKNSLWYRGYRRLIVSTYQEPDGTAEWSSDKLDGEAWSNSSAAQGSLFLNPFDTTSAVATSGGGLAVPIVAGGSFQSGSGTAGGTIRLTVTGHARVATDVITISGNFWKYDKTTGSPEYNFNYNGTYTLNADGDVPNAAGEAVRGAGDLTNTIDIWVNAIDGNFNSFTQTSPDGQIDGGDTLTKSDGVALGVSFTSNVFHQGRVFYAGIPDGEYSDTVFFSGIALKPLAYGQCHQKQDPTDEEHNSLVASDGGTIVIPNLGKVQKMLSVRNSVLIFTDQGVWEVGGGQRGFFTADGYSVRKIAEEECNSPFSPIPHTSGAFFSGAKGIFQVAPNQFTGQLESTSVSEQLIQSLWNEIPSAQQSVVQSVFDDARKRIYWLYGDSTDNLNQYANALVLDIRVGAFYKYTFNVSSTEGVLTAFSITESDSSESNKKLKWVVQQTDSVEMCDLDQSDYLDYDGAESPLPFMVTGWDNLGDFQRRRQAPVITVFNKRTTTGYTATGNGYDADNESSLLMRARWDWSDDAISGKLGSQNQVYRNVRGFAPSGTTDVDGYPVVVTRNKVRGRGRVLQLRFDGEATKDTHLLGYSTNYKISRKV